MAKRIVTITSDWNRQDYYVGMLKGRIYSLLPDVTLVETGDQIAPFRTLEGAFVMRSIMPEFPPESVHLFLVNQGNRPDIFPLLVKSNQRYLIAWEDSVLGLVVEEEPEYCLRITPEVFTEIKRRLDIQNSRVAPSFPALGLFPVLVLAIEAGIPFDELGPHQPELVLSSPWLPVIQDQSITGRIIYIDSYGNAISNISRELFDKMGQARKFEIFLISNHYRLNSINTGYLETEPGEMLALFNSLNFLELAIVHGSIAELLGIEPGSTIKIKFYDA